jgi:hypothetical protein
LPVAAKSVAGQRRLRDTDDVQDQKQGHGERRNVAHGKDRHGASGDSVRIDDPGERAQGQRIDEVGDSQDLPEDEAFAMRRVGQPESRERRCHADGDVAPSGRQGEERGENLIRAESLAASLRSVLGVLQHHGESTYAKYTIHSHILHCLANLENVGNERPGTESKSL